MGANEFVLCLVSMLSGVRNQKNQRLAKERTRIIRELFPGMKDDFSSVSVLLANTLASSGALQEASDVRWTLSQSGSRKQAGLSWTEINGKIEVNHIILVFLVQYERFSAISSA